MALETPQHGVITYWHTQACQQTFGWFAAGCVPQQPDKFRNTAGAPGEGHSQLRQLFNKGPAAATQCSTAPSLAWHFQRHRRTFNGQVPQTPQVAAVVGA
jgi:hypothetical protein